MYSVKRLEKETVITSVEIRPGVTFGTKTGRSVCYGVVDESGKVAIKPHAITGKMQAQIFGQRKTAQMQADWMNENEQSNARA